jgi:hypothetical protein
MRLAAATTATAIMTCGLASVGVGVANAESENCIGLPSIPPAFVCVVSLTPENAIPSIGTSGGTDVTVPAVCYYLDCTEPTTTTVPTPTISGGGSIAVISYNGSTYTVASPLDSGALAGLISELASSLPGQAEALAQDTATTVIAQLGPTGTAIGGVFLTIGQTLCRQGGGSEAVYVAQRRSCVIQGGDLLDPAHDVDRALVTAADVFFTVAFLFGVH